MRVDHIGYAVRRIDRAIDAFSELGYTFGSIIEDNNRNVKLSFGEKDGYRIELVAPLSKEKESPVDQYLGNTVGMPYHICYKSDEFDLEIEELKKNGWKIIKNPAPAVAFNEKRVVFMMNIGFGLMEIVES